MSFKAKFSIYIFMIVLAMFILIVILDQYAALRNMNQDMGEVMKQASVKLSESFDQHPGWASAAASLRDDPEFEPNEMQGLLKKLYPDLEEVTVFRPDSTGILTDDKVLLGTYTFRDEATDMAYAAQAAEMGFQTREVNLNGKEYIKSYYSDASLAPYVIGMVYDCEEYNQFMSMKRMDAITYAGMILLFVLISSYLLAGFMLRPLNAILWKVNEVSLGRFQTAIKVKGKDEFGLLALKINAMSQNLSIYMEKLRQAFEDNRQMKEYLQSFIDHTSDAIHVVDLQGKFIQVNKAFEQLFGYTSEEVFGAEIELVPDTHRGEMRLIINSLQEGKVLPAQETIRMTKSGEIIPVSVTISPIRDTEGVIQAYASITRDMRSRNRMEELLRRSEKLTTVGQLAAGVAHEIRNPLTTLRGFLQLQQHTGKMNLEHTGLMLSELDRINLIVGEFLILAKPQATRFATKDVREVFGNVLSLIDSEGHLHNVTFTTSFTEAPCLVSCEENQLKQVFINLLKNGIEAMPSGGRIHTHIAAKNDQITISITDEGIGIPEEMIPKIGNPFFTGKESGTGLGMMISQRIIHSHQGLMEIKSQVNVGTTIIITLPALKEGNANVILGEGLNKPSANVG